MLQLVNIDFVLLFRFPLVCISGSMANDIAAVKEQVHEIVENSSPEIFILVPFNDPGKQV